ncbi:hypothetical protein HY024_04050 [Candidatus Curtissbacteria bacterium]|nr:hypothetical protein [Candidatus Curtissbacteria bacterium]
MSGNERPKLISEPIRREDGLVVSVHELSDGRVTVTIGPDLHNGGVSMYTKAEVARIGEGDLGVVWAKFVVHMQKSISRL